MDALTAEADLRLEGFGITTVYVGGGTPSLLPATFWEAFLGRIASLADPGDPSEVTMEVNPGTAGPGYMKTLKRAGFDRLSLGMQSLHDDVLLTLGRIHDSGRAADCFRQAREAGFDNISVDLIYGVPGQTPESWEDDLSAVIELGPEHVSCYELTLEEGTKMWRRFPEWRDGCGDGFDGMYFIAHELLTDAGYVHYEVSNYAACGERKSVHNRRYWRRLPYVGLGPSAHSFDGVFRRTWNTASVNEYVGLLKSGRSPEAGGESLTAFQAALEIVMLGLRNDGGFDMKELPSGTGCRIDEAYLEFMADAGRVTVSGSRIMPTALGMLFADGDAAALLSFSGFDR